MATETDPPPLPASLGPVLEFMHSLWRLERALSERSKDLRKRHRLTATERLVIRLLGQRPGTSAGEVARVLHILPSTLTPILHQLVARGIVRRTPDPADRRRAVLWLTARGERIDADSAATVDERVRATLARMPASEVFHARRVMSAIAQALGETDDRSSEKHARRKPARRPPAVPRIREAGARRQGSAAAPAEQRRGAAR